MTGKLPFSANVAALELHQGLDLSASHATVMKKFAAALQDAYDRGAEDAARAVLPEGSVVVPREPTDAMKAAGGGAKIARTLDEPSFSEVLDSEGVIEVLQGVEERDRYGQEVAAAVYRAMIAAATEDAR